MKNTYTYDEIRIDYCQIGDCAVLLVVDFAAGGIERRVMTPSPVVDMTIDSYNHTRIETEMSIIETRNF